MPVQLYMDTKCIKYAHQSCVFINQYISTYTVKQEYLAAIILGGFSNMAISSIGISITDLDHNNIFYIRQFR